jgi:hypothetical protein
MGRIFLSASVPVKGRGDFFDSANPFLIQFAVRELLTVCLGRRTIVWGGHPAITPMVWAVCESLGVQYATAVKLYQSRLFQDAFPEENLRFQNVNYVPAVGESLAESLKRMRRAMLRGKFEAGVFIGGMEGIFDEYEMFRELHPNAKIVALRAPGGAAMQLARRLRQKNDGVDFARIFHRQLNVSAQEPRRNRR